MKDILEDISKVKEEYKNIKAPESLYKDVDNLIKKDRKDGKRKRNTAIVASFVIFGVGLLNASPKIALASNDIPVISNIVKVLTFNRFSDEVENSYEVEIDYPIIEGLTDKELEKSINKEFKKEADIILDNFYLENNEQIENNEELHTAIYHGYKVLTNNEKYLSLDIFTEEVMASSFTNHRFMTIDKKTNKILSLDEFFTNPDYIEVISEYIYSEMESYNKENDDIYFIGDEVEDGFTGITKDTKFYINEKDEIVIVFNEYEVAPGFMGMVEFTLPNDLIKGL